MGHPGPLYVIKRKEHIIQRSIRLEKALLVGYN